MIFQPAHKVVGDVGKPGQIINKPTQCPEGTTHVWTPAVEEPSPLPWVHRRAFYKLDTTCSSYSKTLNSWMPTKNTPEWFEEETKAGYFVTREQFENPSFVMKKEEK